MKHAGAPYSGAPALCLSNIAAAETPADHREEEGVGIIGFDT